METGSDLSMDFYDYDGNHIGSASVRLQIELIEEDIDGGLCRENLSCVWAGNNNCG